MESRLRDIRSTRNPKARIKIMTGHFATTHSHVNIYIDMSTVKCRHNNARETAKTLAEKICAYHTDRYDHLYGRYGSYRDLYGGNSSGKWRNVD